MQSQPKYDLLIKNGTIIDPVQKLNGQKDLAIKNGRIALLQVNIPAGQASAVVNASECVVTPGLVDLHVHVYPGVSHYGVDPDHACLSKGATTVVDAGSSGADTFAGLKKYIIDVSDTRVFAFLNISSIGMVSRLVNELEDIRYANVEKAISVCERNREVIQGIKVRLSSNIVGNNGLKPLKIAKKAAEALGLPLMLHVGSTPTSLEEILIEMKSGDIMTHCYHGRQHGILDQNGHVLPEVKAAQKSGILFDVGHGMGSFSFDVAREAMKQNILPATISSDLHYYNIFGPVYDLATTMSKFLLLGLPIDEVVAKTTSTPASCLGLSEQLGSLKEETIADVAVFRYRTGQFEFEDSMKKKMIGTKQLEPAAVIKGGLLYSCILPVKR